MNMENNSPLSSEKLAWAITLLVASLLLDLILAGYGLANLGVEIDPQSMTNQQANPLQVAMGCLAPVSGILKLIGIILAFIDSRRLGGTHRQLTLASLLLFLVSGAVLVGAIFMSIGATLQGSLQSYFLTTWLSVGGSLLSFLAIALLVYVPSPQWAKIALLVGLALYIIGTIGTTVLTNNSTTLSSYEMMGNTYYIPKIDVNRTAGLYPVLAILGTLPVAIYLVTYLVLAIQSWRSTNSEVPETVS